jgi:hypothetical protein
VRAAAGESNKLSIGGGGVVSLAAAVPLAGVILRRREGGVASQLLAVPVVGERPIWNDCPRTVQSGVFCASAGFGENKRDTPWPDSLPPGGEGNILTKRFVLKESDQQCITFLSR